MNHNYITMMDNTGALADWRSPRQAGQLARFNCHFYEPGMSSFPRSKVSKQKSQCRGTPWATRTTPSLAIPDIPTSSLTIPTSALTIPTSSLTIPDIRLEPSSERLVQDTPSVWDIHGDARLSEILDRLQAGTTGDGSKTVDLVTLPGRYTRLQSSARETAAPLRRELNTVGEDMRARETDLSTALKWIRQEILHMKQQDTCLLRQFAHLHDSILQLRGLYDMHSSCSDVSSLDGSTYSLNEQARSPSVRRLVLDGSLYPSKPSASLPSSPRVSRFKWVSKDIV